MMQNAFQDLNLVKTKKKWGNAYIFLDCVIGDGFKQANFETEEIRHRDSDRKIRVITILPKANILNKSENLEDYECGIAFDFVGDNPVFREFGHKDFIRIHFGSKG